MKPSIFSPYRQGENRITASIIAVLRSLSVEHVDRLIGALIQETGFELVNFQNQSSKGGKGVPDADISSHCRILLETKIQRNAVDVQQLKRHLARLDDGPNQYLIVLTPDNWKEQDEKAIGDSRIVWTSFADLDQAINDLLKDETGVISERETFLLRELQKMLVEEGLLRSGKDTVVVAARYAWELYQSLSAYICQPYRSFQDVSHIAFYASGEVKPLVPKIVSKYQGVEFRIGIHEGRLGEIVDTAIDTKTHDEGIVQDVYDLSKPDSPDTVVLPEPIPNDLRSNMGRGTAFTQGQRYVNISDLLKAKSTSGLVHGSEEDTQWTDS